MLNSEMSLSEGTEKSSSSSCNPVKPHGLRNHGPLARRFYTRTILFAGFLLIPVAMFAQDRPEDIQKLYDQYRSGVLNGNAEAIAELFTEDGRVYHSDGTVEKGRAAIRKNRSKNFERSNYVSVQWEPTENFYVGENAWTEIGRFTGIIENDQGEENKNSYEYTAINEKIDGEWKIKRISVHRWGS